MDSAKSQSDMRECANQEAVRADAALESIYKKLLGTARGLYGGEVLVRKIEAAQDAWTKFRDATVAAYCPEDPISQTCGTLYFTTALLVRTSLTWKQVDELKALLDSYTI